MDRRALPGLFGGLAGCAFAVTGAALQSPVLGIVAAACSLVAGACSLTVVERAQRAERRTAIADAELATLRHLEAGRARGPSAVVDQESGLPDRRFFDLALDNRIASARRHLWPVTVVLLELTPHPHHHLPEAVAAFTSLVRQTLREADTACRLAPRRFAFILEDTNEAGGVWAAERVQVALTSHDTGAAGLAAGVASYPTHGLVASDVLVQAESALRRAVTADSGHGLGRVEVASVELG